MPPSSLDSEARAIDIASIERRYFSALEDFFNHQEEKALYRVSELGKELVLARQGPDILLEMHGRSLQRFVRNLDAVAISRMVINANEVLLSGIMAYAMNYYSYLDLLEAERKKLESVKVELQAQAERLEEANRKLQAVDRDREHTLLQQSRLAAMGEMLGNISHQWRQPLNVLGLILQNMLMASEKGSLTKETVERGVTRCRQLIAHMSQTIDDFRSYLKPERARSDFDVAEVVGKAIAILGETLQQIKVVVEPPAEPVVIRGYRNEYAQAVINILINARDVLRDGKVPEPVIRVAISSEGGRSVVTISDNGGGIPDDIIERIFDPYFTTKGPDRGTGIGLFMCKTLIEKNMNGALSVRNTEEGAEFRIEV